MTILNVNKLEKNFGYGTLFEDVYFSLNEGESISIVGPNGCGKSTILKIIAGIEKSDKGNVNIKKGAKVAYLDQTSSSVKDNRVVYDILKDAFSNLNLIENQLLDMQSKLESNKNEKQNNTIITKYCDLMEKFSINGGYEIESNINKVIHGLNINENLLTQKYNTLSGGEKTLVQLAKILLIKPELILLDEPTNHLDIDRIEWLEEYIKSFKGASVIVSHDRYFLDTMSNKILSMDGNGNCKVYFTNYSGYLIEKEKDLKKQLDEYGNQQEAIKQLEAKAKEFMNLGMARNSSSLTKQGKTLWERAQKMRELAIKKPIVERKLNVEFVENNKYSKKIIETKGLSVLTYDGIKIIDNINLDISAGERIAIIGGNGAGKSTFIKTIMGIQDLHIEGQCIIGPSVKIGYIPQIIDFPNNDYTLLKYFSNAVSLNEEKVRSILARFKFNVEDVNKRVKNLSGGEKMRIKLAELLQQEVNTLILDEPTNHIDIPTKEVLEEALEDFNGTFIFISHDRYFINKFAEKIIEFKKGHITLYLGNYDDYKKKINELK